MLAREHTLSSESYHSGSKGWSPRISYREESCGAEMQVLRPHPRPANSGALGGSWLSSLCFHKLPAPSPDDADVSPHTGFGELPG